MRKLVLFAIFCASVFYAPVPLTAQSGGGQTPLIPVADMPVSGGAEAPAEPPLEVDSEEVPELVPPREVGGGAQAPADEPEQSSPPAMPEPEPEAEPEPEPAAVVAPQAHVAVPSPEPPIAEQAQAEENPAEEPVEPPEQGPTDRPPDDEEGDEFEEDFGEGPEPGQPEDDIAPRATEAGPQLPRTGADLPALLLSGLALTTAGMSLRALCAPRA